MKVALLSASGGVRYFTQGLEESLRSRGHTVKFFYEYMVPSTRKDSMRLPWTKGDFERLVQFDPDAVIVWHGRVNEAVRTQVAKLQKLYKAMFCENGWLPQKGNVYIDPVGVDEASLLATLDLGEPTCAVDNYADCVDAYINALPQDRPSLLPDDYIAIPLQIESDPHILNGWPGFRGFDKFVLDMVSAMPNRNFVVKVHPKDAARAPIRHPQITWVGAEAGISMNAVSYWAERVIGVNSTSLVEALIYRKPVVMFGKSILSSSPGVALFAANASIGELESFRPNSVRIANCIHNLLATQISWNGVTGTTALNSLRSFDV